MVLDLSQLNVIKSFVNQGQNYKGKGKQTLLLCIIFMLVKLILREIFLFSNIFHLIFNVLLVLYCNDNTFYRDLNFIDIMSDTCFFVIA